MAPLFVKDVSFHQVASVTDDFDCVCAVSCAFKRLSLVNGSGAECHLSFSVIDDGTY